MSAQIGEETTLLLISIYSGIILVLCYDTIRIFRRLRKASIVRSIVEEVIFWTIASIYLFHIFLKYNYGSPRYFGVGATALTMIFYEWFIGRKIIDYIAEKLRKILIIMLKPLKKIINGFTLVIRKIIRSIKRLLHYRKKVKK